ncbi:hypothetical protein PSEUDO9AG_20015 [Pseudomonas sp. 9Ag]|nr:hypothetical protein PSEUDO9AG_20015 [Pseudomonas sp. 9Ag]
MLPSAEVGRHPAWARAARPPAGTNRLARALHIHGSQLLAQLKGGGSVIKNAICKW